jgi:glycosyltransferase involved in cell wall biosynthesis
MNSKVKFSVVVPSYNKEYSILRAINSIISQTVQADEIIIVNDGSTDSTLDILNLAFSDFENVIILNQTNKGVSIARNTGIEIASSEFVCFLDSDDEWDPRFLERISGLINNFPEAICFSTAHQRVIREYDKINYVSAYKHDYEGYVDDFFERSLVGSILNSSKACIRRSSVRELGGFPESVTVGEDLILWIRIALDGKIAYSTEALVNIYVETDNSRASRKGIIPYPLRFVSELCVQGEKKGLNVSSYLRAMHFKHCIVMLRDGYFLEARKQIAFCENLFFNKKL